MTATRRVTRRRSGLRWHASAGLAAAAALLAGLTSPAQAEGSEPWWYDAMRLDQVHEQTRGEA